MQTPWGKMLLLKLAVAACMVATGAYATYGLVPRVRGTQALGLIFLFIVALL